MAKYPTFPTLFDNVLQLRLSKLKELGYFEPGFHKKGTLTWGSGEKKTSSLSLAINYLTSEPFFELEYTFNGVERKYSISTTSIASNLGKGIVWYFLCPKTGKRCRVLYLIGGYFLHRDASSGFMYKKQTESKFYRDLDKGAWGASPKIEEIHKQLYSKHFKSFYRGKPTKRYLRLLKELERIERLYRGFRFDLTSNNRRNKK